MPETESERRRRKTDEMRGKRERRIFDAGLELREKGGNLRLVGWACLTGIEYPIGDPAAGGFVEVVRPGAFRRSLENRPDVVLVIQHGDALSGLPIARTKSGTLELTEDERGLAVSADLDVGDPDVQMLQRKFTRGDLDGQMSFAFWVPSGGDNWSDDYRRREITQAEIHQGDVSVVTFGASPTTTSELVARQASGAAHRPIPDHTTAAVERLAQLGVSWPQRRRLTTEAARRAGLTGDALLAGSTTRPSDYYATRLAELRRDA